MTPRYEQRLAQLENVNADLGRRKSRWQRRNEELQRQADESRTRTFATRAVQQFLPAQMRDAEIMDQARETVRPLPADQ